MRYQYTILHSETMAEGFLPLKRYRLQHSLFAGGMSAELVRERVEGYQAASLLPYDPVTDKVVLVEQFRIGAIEDAAGAWILEVVGGIIEGDNAPDQVARQEAMEESGCEVAELVSICNFLVSPGTSSERIHLFCGRVDSSKANGIHGLDAEGEDIRVVVMSAEAAIQGVASGRINSTASIIALQWLALNREQLRQRWLDSEG
ncbi:MAG: NUDIX domain-containing protein [Gammaproteobacteria bacterium]|nr:NUDIX domain-containing protein [Gammaproteobacteria bacterium]